MEAAQIFIVGGTLNGKREISDPLPAFEACYFYNLLKKKGYSQLTMTDARTGEDYDVGKFTSPGFQTKQ
jgi:hypothetical protein